MSRLARFTAGLMVGGVLLSGCQREDSVGYTTTHDGRLVAETAEVARDELAWTLARRAEATAGTGWKATAEIPALPEKELFREASWDWRVLPVTVRMHAPAAEEPLSTSLAEATRGLVIDAVTDVAVRRTRRRADVQVTVEFPAPAAENAAKNPAQNNATSYTIQAGDTWAELSGAFYGTPQHWRLIADANPGASLPLTAGTVIVIPPAP